MRPGLETEGHPATAPEGWAVCSHGEAVVPDRDAYSARRDGSGVAAAGSLRAPALPSRSRTGELRPAGLRGR